MAWTSLSRMCSCHQTAKIWSEKHLSSFILHSLCSPTPLIAPACSGNERHRSSSLVPSVPPAVSLLVQPEFGIQGKGEKQLVKVFTNYHDHTELLHSAAASLLPLKNVTWFDIQAK